MVKQYHCLLRQRMCMYACVCMYVWLWLGIPSPLFSRDACETLIFYNGPGPEPLLLFLLLFLFTDVLSNPSIAAS